MSPLPGAAAPAAPHPLPAGPRGARLSAAGAQLLAQGAAALPQRQSHQAAHAVAAAGAAGAVVLGSAGAAEACEAVTAAAGRSVFTFGELLSLAAAQSVDTDVAAPLWKKLDTHAGEADNSNISLDDRPVVELLQQLGRLIKNLLAKQSLRQEQGLSSDHLLHLLATCQEMLCIPAVQDRLSDIGTADALARLAETQQQLRARAAAPAGAAAGVHGLLAAAAQHPHSAAGARLGNAMGSSAAKAHTATSPAAAAAAARQGGSAGMLLRAPAAAASAPGDAEALPEAGGAAPEAAAGHRYEKGSAAAALAAAHAAVAAAATRARGHSRPLPAVELLPTAAQAKEGADSAGGPEQVAGAQAEAQGDSGPMGMAVTG